MIKKNVVLEKERKKKQKYGMLIFGVKILFQATKQHLNNGKTVKK